MSAVAAPVERSEKGQFVPKAPKPDPMAAFFRLFTDALQAHADSVSRKAYLPAVSVGKDVLQPSEDYEDPNESDPKKKWKVRPRLACEIDEKGNVILGSGPFVGDECAIKLWEMMIPWFEHFMQFTRSDMSRCALLPESKGVIDDRTKLIRIPEGRFIFDAARR